MALWLPPSRPARSGKAAKKGGAGGGPPLSPAAARAARRIAARAGAELARNPEAARLARELKSLSEKLKKCERHPVSPKEVFREDAKLGRDASWYDAEAVALAADAEYVALAHNRQLLEDALDAARRKAAKRACEGLTGLLAALKEDERAAALAAAGFGPGILSSNGCGPPPRLPARAAGRWRIAVKPVRDEGDWEPDPEVAELMEEDAARGMGDALKELLAADLVRPGRRILVWRAEEPGRGGAGEGRGAATDAGGEADAEELQPAEPDWNAAGEEEVGNMSLYMKNPAFPRGPVPDPRGADLPWEKLHERPFTPEEAAELLASAGIPCERIASRRVAEWQDLWDPETGRGPAKGQVVVALIKAAGDTQKEEWKDKGWKEDGSQLRAVHLAFVWDEEARAWRLARAMVELAV